MDGWKPLDLLSDFGIPILKVSQSFFGFRHLPKKVGDPMSLVC